MTAYLSPGTNREHRAYLEVRVHTHCRVELQEYRVRGQVSHDSQCETYVFHILTCLAEADRIRELSELKHRVLRQREQCQHYLTRPDISACSTLYALLT